MENNQVLTATADEIKAKISRLASLSELDLKKAMGDLKGMLLDNPTAVQQMEPADLGELIKSQRRMVGSAADVAAAKPKGTRAKAKPKFTASELMDIDLGEL